MERHLQHLWHPWCGWDFSQQGRLPAWALHVQTHWRHFKVSVHSVWRGLQDVCGEGVCQGAVEDLPGGSGHKLPLDSFKWTTNHENRTYCLSCGQSANQVYQLRAKLAWDNSGVVQSETWADNSLLFPLNPPDQICLYTGTVWSVLLARWTCVEVEFT